MTHRNRKRKRWEKHAKPKPAVQSPQVAEVGDSATFADKRMENAVVKQKLRLAKRTGITQEEIDELRKLTMRNARDADGKISNAAIRNGLEMFKVDVAIRMKKRELDILQAKDGSTAKPTADLEYMPLGEADVPLLETSTVAEATVVPESDSA